MRLSTRSSRVRYQYSAPLLFFFPFFFFLFFSPWEVVSSVCTFFFCNTPPTCNHHLQLRLCWEITMHKSHGQTLDKVVIDLRPKEGCTGLTFVCLSRAKRLVDLMVEPMSFDRIGNLRNSWTMKARLQEEVRLVELAQGTRTTRTWASSAPSRVTNEVPFSSRCTTKSIAKKSPTGSLPPAVPLGITPTFRPWTHTSDDSYIYQLSLVLTTATVSSYP